MLKNHLKFAVRLFVKDRFYSILNIAGLTLGITIGIILLLILQYDLTFDKHHLKHERIFRYTQKMEAPGAEFDVAVSAPELAEVFYQELPEVEAVVRIEDVSRSLVTHITDKNEVKKFYESKIIRSDSTLFDVFTHHVLKGNLTTALKGKNKAVISASTAERYFGDVRGLGEVLMMPDSQLYEISAIIEDIPDNTHVKYDIILSGVTERTPNDELQYSEAFWNPELYTYILFKEGVDEQRFYERFPDIYDKSYKLFAEKIDGKVEPLLEPLADIHFHSTKIGDYSKGDIKFMYASVSIGLFIILLACINYMNMSTARATKRVSEMAIRKVLGFSKTRLFISVLTEAMLMAFAAMVIAVFFSYYIIEFSNFEYLLGRNLKFNIFSNLSFIAGIICLTFLIGLISGIYPALYIPSIPVVQALKGNKSIKLSGGWLRKTLIGFQFFLSLTVIMATVIMGRQIEFLKTKETGFQKDNMITIPLPENRDISRTEVFVNSLSNNSNILSVTSASNKPGNNLNFQVFKLESDNNGTQQQKFNSIYVGDDFLDTYNMKIIKGRGFEKNNPSEYFYSYIINEAAVRELGWQDDAIGKRVTFFHDQKWGQVIGVVKDFNFMSLHMGVQPMIIIYSENINDILTVRLSGENISSALESINQAWNDFYPSQPLEYEFIDQSMKQQYVDDEVQHSLIRMLSYTCFFISILGLIGLSAFTASQKTKEIGIRKSLGASVPEILALFSKDYFKLIIIAFLVAVPVANYIATEWMGNFAYQMEINYWYFIIPSVIILVLALATVSFQSLKAAKANPVKALASE